MGDEEYDTVATDPMIVRGELGYGILSHFSAHHCAAAS